MRKLIVFLLFLILSLAVSPQKVTALQACPNVLSGIDKKVNVYEDADFVHYIEIDMSDGFYAKDGKYRLHLFLSPHTLGMVSPDFELGGNETYWGNPSTLSPLWGQVKVSGNKATWIIADSSNVLGGDYSLLFDQNANIILNQTLEPGKLPVDKNAFCDVGSFETVGVEGAVAPNSSLCDQIPYGRRTDCLECVADPDNPQGVWTAIGCVPTDSNSIIATIVQLVLGIAGGITLLLILSGAFRLSVSAGDPKQAEEAKEQITSAIIGLLFIIFSVTILRFIGVNLLQIPGFGG